jgi:hypothetical protein
MKGVMLDACKRDDGRYYINVVEPIAVEYIGVAKKTIDVNEFHKRLGHPSSLVVMEQSAKEWGVTMTGVLEDCIACNLNKNKGRIDRVPNDKSSTTRVGQRVSLDLIIDKEHGQTTYLCVDHFSSYMIVQVGNTRQELANFIEKVLDFYLQVTGKEIESITSDNEVNKPMIL